MSNKTLTKDDLTAVFESQSANQWNIRKTTAAQRIEKLTKLREAISANEEAIKAALYSDLRRLGDNADFELNICYGDIDDAVANLEDWMAEVPIASSGAVPDSTAKVIYEPKGVVLVFGAWNFPFSLLMQPIIALVAAGNCALVKPNEMSPQTSAISTAVIQSVFESDEVAVFEGDVALANQMLELPVDHIFFTGSPAVGKVVMAAAAKHLASVTLELGGKNPVVIDREADIQDAAGKIAFLRNMNSGQVCLCPENIWVHEDKKDEFVAIAQATFQAAFYQDDKINADATGKIIDARNLARIKGYLDDAKAKGAEVACGGDVNEDTNTVNPTILCNVPSNANILSEEVFGPILSIFTYKDITEVYQALSKEPKPLALYVFSANDAFVNDVLANTASGGVTVNSCIMHAAEHNLPFGGVGNSGMGRYHSIHGFKELSHERAVLFTK